MYNPYNPYSYPVAQQRLQNMEQQYNYNNQPAYNNYNQYNNQQFLKGRAVTSIDEAKAAMIDLDGSIFIFPDISNKSIYTKQINLDGTASINTYKLVQEVPPDNINNSINNNIQNQNNNGNVVAIADDISTIKDMLINMESQIKELQTNKNFNHNENNKNWKGAKINESVSNDTTIAK